MAKSAKAKSEPKIQAPLFFRLIIETLGFLKADWQLFLGLSAWFLIATWLLAGLPSQLAYLDLRVANEDLFGKLGGLASTISGLSFGELEVNQTEAQQLSSLVLIVIFVLCFIGAARLRMAKTAVGVRDILYSAPAPIVPFLITFVLTLLVLLPAALGTVLISYVISQGTFNPAELSLLGLVSLALITISLYFALQFIIALLIVTLPAKRPVAAIKDAKDLVAGKRKYLLLQLTALGLFLASVFIVTLSPIVFLDQILNNQIIPLVPIVLDVLGIFAWVFGVIFMYKLYRSLL